MQWQSVCISDEHQTGKCMIKAQGFIRQTAPYSGEFAGLVYAPVYQLHLLIHCGAFKDPTDTCILHILWQPHEHPNNRHTSYHFKYPSIMFWSQTQVLQSLRHFITDHRTELKSAKALMPWNKCLSKWAAFHITVRNRAKYLLHYLHLYHTVFTQRLEK